MSRNILLLFDGTSQDLTNQIPTTIGNLEHLINNNNSQLTKYNKGLARFENNPLAVSFGTKMNKLSVYPNLDFLDKIGLNSEDEITIIGYSRGAESAKRVIQHLGKENVKVKQFIALESVDITGALPITNLLGLNLNKPTYLDNVSEIIHYKTLNETRPVYIPTDYKGNQVQNIWIPTNHTKLGGARADFQYDRTICNLLENEISEMLIHQGFKFTEKKPITQIKDLPIFVKQQPIKRYKKPNINDFFHNMALKYSQNKEFENQNPNINLEDIPTKQFVHFNSLTKKYESI